MPKPRLLAGEIGSHIPEVYAIVPVSPRRYVVVTLNGKMNVINDVELNNAYHGKIICGPTTYDACTQFVASSARGVS